MICELQTTCNVKQMNTLNVNKNTRSVQKRAFIARFWAFHAFIV